jgi:hypothetical protein
VETIEGLIETAIREAEETGAGWLSYAVSYLCCLSAITNTYDGPPLDQDRLRRWRSTALAVFDDNFPGYDSVEEFEEDRNYVEHVFSTLIEGDPDPPDDG